MGKFTHVRFDPGGWSRNFQIPYARARSCGPPTPTRSRSCPSSRSPRTPRCAPSAAPASPATKAATCPKSTAMPVAAVSAPMPNNAPASDRTKRTWCRNTAPPPGAALLTRSSGRRIIDCAAMASARTFECENVADHSFPAPAIGCERPTQPKVTVLCGSMDFHETLPAMWPNGRGLVTPEAVASAAGASQGVSRWPLGAPVHVSMNRTAAKAGKPK